MLHPPPFGRGMRPVARTIGALAAAAGSVLLQPGVVAAHGAVPVEPPTAATIALGWSFEPLVALPLAALAVGWGLIVRRIDRAHPAHRVPRIRTAAFLGGLLAIAIGLMSGIERYDTTLFSIHMVQHILLILVGAPLIALAAPITQLLRAASPGVRRRWILPVLHSRIVSALAHPVVAWLLFTVVLWGSHFSPLFDLSLENRDVHNLEHAAYLASALLFWWPVMGLDPAPYRMGHAARGLYVLLQMPVNSFLSMIIVFAGAPLYRHYATLGSPYGISALSDQQAAGGIMWVVGDVIFIVAVLGVVAAWMRHEDREEPARDRRLDAERAALRERADRLARGSSEPPART